MFSSVDRLIWQYEKSPNVRALIVSALSEFDDIETALAALRTRLDIDASVGVQLDGIGEIIGQPRPRTVEIDPADAFAFDGPDPGKGFSSTEEPTVGGQMVSVNGLLVGDMPDADYRVLLRAAIYASYGFSDLDHLIGYCEAVLQSNVFISDGIGFVTITASRPVTVGEVQLITDTMPLAAGVRIGYIAAPSETITTFAFDGPDDGGGFDDVAGSAIADSGGFVGIV